MAKKTTKPRFEKIELPGGVTVLCEHLPAVQTVSLGLWLRAGSRDEPDGLQGACHYIEHMLFKGTKRRSARDIAIHSESVGALMNAMTGKEITCFYAKSLSEDLPLMVDILSDMFFGSVFDPAEFDREKQVILEEIKNMNDDPEDSVFEQFIEDCCGRAGLGHCVLGYEDTVGSFTRDKLYELYKSSYTPRGLLVAVAGNLNGADVPKLVTDALARFPKRGSKKKTHLERTKPGAFQRGVRVYNRNIEQANFVVGVPGIPYDHDDRYIYSLLDVLLSGGMSSRLFQEVREKRGLVYDIATGNETYCDAGFFTISAGTRPANLREVLAITAAELVKIRNGEITNEELARVRQQFRAGMAMSFENPSGRMMKISRSEIYFGRELPDAEIMEQVLAVTSEDIARVASNIAKNGNFSASVLGPFKSKTKINEVKSLLEDVLNNF